ncbi:metallophosphoesterase [Acuticoccus sp. MNP-M23]|uniref:metallophosphoesterase family protein n=1 Tax=Acuticoccus sp. MNP-M23 TaxID=3072793 RepID=UPI0028160868|nr:metallophosphoesterase [Acuticoccus sp. MNP-M23]WMS44475.1 metallophosphoesterase [Acuticoccus sp. MNP-M23]
MTAIAQLSDIHFGSESDGAAAQLVDAINREPLDLVILSGDLTMAARRREFELAREFIDALKAPTFCVPGNHDITPYQLAERFGAPYRRWRKYVSEELEPVWQNTDVAVVGLNTARRMRLQLDWSHGTVSRKQISRLGGRFDALDETPFRIVVAHHPFLAEETDDLGVRPRVMVKRATEALEAFCDARVDLVLAGHLHRTYAAAYEGEDVPAPETGVTAGEVLAEAETARHRVTTIQAGTALSARTRGEENSFNRIDIEDGAMRVHAVVLGEDGWRRAAVPLVTVSR